MSEIWAKSNGVSLKKHIEDILRCIDYLPLDKINLSNKDLFKKLLKFAIFFHDLGKVSPTFQKEIHNPHFSSLKDDFPKIRHNIFSLFFINKNKVKEICENKLELYTLFLSAIAFHHWKIDEIDYLLYLNSVLKEVAIYLLEKKETKQIGEELAEILKNHLKGLKIENETPEDLISFDFHLAYHLAQEGDLVSANILPPYSLYYLPERLRVIKELKIDLNLWIFLVGFLMRADHFASLIESEEKIDFKDFEREIKNINLFERLKDKFKENFWQEEVKEKKDNNLILIAPTGIGKTEFALLWAEGEKTFFTLPLRVATNQIFERACEYFNVNNFPNSEDEDVSIRENVGLLHSDADLYLIEKSGSFKSTSFDGEHLRILELSRHFSLPLNICTGDQIFPSALKYPTYEKIYATLSYSKLIIDEIQAYDPRACAIIVKMIEDIVNFGGKFLLMTATLPSFILEEIKERINISEENILNIYNKNVGEIVRHKIKLEEKDIEDSVEEILKKANEGKRILVVLNTIEKAERVYNHIKSKINSNSDIFIEILHSRFTLKERRDKENKLTQEFCNPKPENDKKPKILVATQVVEASLDIDADYLFTEIAPIDSLIQRMGRVMRRVDILTGKIKGTDKKFEYSEFYVNNEPNILIFFLKERKIKESGEGKVYEQELLGATYDILKEIEEIKEKEKQDLVEKLYEKYKSEKPSNSKYLEKFRNTLLVLDSGLISENKEEAHNIFREIHTIPIIEDKDNQKIKEII
ncbi:MAG: CRISPR-associated helicase Cas3', partial [candidate division WOR-3 bacterium]|nr:CRISPR-associated helicase Cas3' [candidate division WOR-3 bacterium]